MRYVGAHHFTSGIGFKGPLLNIAFPFDSNIHTAIVRLEQYGRHISKLGRIIGCRDDLQMIFYNF